MKIFIVALLILLMASCTSSRVSRNLASGAIGCPANKISIFDERASFDGSHNFEAICRGQRFFCHYHQTSGVDCTKALAQSDEQSSKSIPAEERLEGEYYYTDRKEVVSGQECVEDEGWPPSDKLLCKPVKANK